MTVSRVLKNSNVYVSTILEKILDYVKRCRRIGPVSTGTQQNDIAIFLYPTTYFWEEINKGVQIAATQIKPFTIRYDIIRFLN